MRLHRKDTAKRLLFLKYRKLINKGQSDHDHKEARRIENVH